MIPFLHSFLWPFPLFLFSSSFKIWSPFPAHFAPRLGLRLVSANRMWQKWPCTSSKLRPLRRACFSQFLGTLPSCPVSQSWLPCWRSRIYTAQRWSIIAKVILDLATWVSPAETRRTKHPVQNSVLRVMSEINYFCLKLLNLGCFAM